MAAKSPVLLTSEQRARLMSIPDDLTDREMARYYTLTPADSEVINSHRRPHNRLGFAVQLCLLRFPGRTLADAEAIPERVLAYIAAQLQVEPEAFNLYGQRDNTRYEHLDEIRQAFGFRNCGRRESLQLARVLRQAALASDRALALIEAALEFSAPSRSSPLALPRSKGWCGASSGWPLAGWNAC